VFTCHRLTPLPPEWGSDYNSYVTFLIADRFLY
jgi:hypothetical protein